MNESSALAWSLSDWSLPMFVVVVVCDDHVVLDLDVGVADLVVVDLERLIEVRLEPQEIEVVFQQP